MKYVNYLLLVLFVITLAVVMRPVLYSCGFSVAVAYILNPVVNRLETLGLPRMFSAFVIMFSFTCAVGTAVVILTPILYSQALDIVKLFMEEGVPLINFEDLKNFLSSSGLPMYKDIVNDTGDPVNFVKQNIFNSENAEFLKIFQSASSYFGKAIAGIAHSSLGVGYSLIKVLMTFILSFYILGHWPKISSTIFYLIPRRYLENFSYCTKKMDEVISAYLRGQTIVCLILSCYYCLCFTVVGIDYSLVLGFFSGLMTFIPHVGPFICAVLSMCLAAHQGFGLTKVAIVLAVFIVGITAESNVITPAIIGRKLSISPAWLLIGMVVLSSHIGFLGTLLSVPMTAVVGVLVQFIMSRYTRSNFYLSK